MGLDAQGTETHGAHDEALDDGLHGLHLLNGNGGAALEVQQVAQEERLGLAVHGGGEFFEFLVAAQARGDLQRGDGLGVPGVGDAALAVMELAHVGQEVGLRRFGICLRVEPHGVARNGLQADAADGRALGTEVLAQQAFVQADALEDLGAAVGADGGNTHLGHDLQQAFFHGVDIVGLRCSIVLLDLSFLDKVVEDGVDHVWAQC